MRPLINSQLRSKLIYVLIIVTNITKIDDMLLMF